jgi:hypothetical protein
VNDLERELRSLLETKAGDARAAPRPVPRVLKRARRRQRVTVLTAIVGALAILAGSIVGFRALERIGGTHLPADVPALPDAPEGFRSVVLPYGSIAYPEGWTLLASKGDREILHLTNFDSEFDTSCFAADGQALPPLGAVLLIRRFPAEDLSLPTWPVDLTDPGPSALDCRGAQEGDFGEPEQFQATWRSGSATFVANAALGRLAPEEVRRLLFESFGSLHVIGGDAPQTEELLGERNVILDAFDSPAGPVTLYAYRDDSEGGTSWIGIAGTAGTHLSGAGSIGGEVPRADENVTMNLDNWGGVVWGDVAATVARAELRTVEGASYPATLVPLPPSLEAQGHQAVWGVVTQATGDRVTTLLYDAEGNVLGDYVPLGRKTVATGEDPEGGPWELYLEVTTDGTGLGFKFQRGGAGSGCCLRPLRGDFQPDGFQSGSAEPSVITALASDAVTKVVFEARSGETIEGTLFPVPDPKLRIPQVALVIVPRAIAVRGELVAYDDAGAELAREPLGDFGEPPGPTPEIDAVWKLLRQARDAISRWSADHEDSLATFTLDEARRSIRDIAWNASGPGKPVPGEVSIRGVERAGGSELTGLSGWTVAIVSTTPPPNGLTYCIAVNIDEGGGGNFRYGTQDAASYSECRGGWPELSN